MSKENTSNKSGRQGSNSSAYEIFTKQGSDKPVVRPNKGNQNK